MRRIFIGCLLGGILVGAARADESDLHQQAAVDNAVERGVAFLISKQHADGAIVATAPPDETHANAMTSLSLMALAAVGHQPTDDTPAGHAMRKAMNFILGPSRQDTNNVNGTEAGYYGHIDGSKMYGHGITTLMLAEMAGMGVDARQDAVIRDHCQKAIDLIVRAQKVAGKQGAAKGGWRYEPSSTDSDLSVTVWQVMALRAARNSGLIVPKETVDDAVEYLKRSYYSGRDKDGKPLNLKSGFAYTPGGGPSYPMASAGLLAMQVCGEYDAPELAGTVNWLRENTPKTTNANFFFYGTYYYAQGMYQRGGMAATEARQFVENLLLADQKTDGKWLGGSQENSDVYCTALAILSLSVRYHFMPIYQR